MTADLYVRDAAGRFARLPDVLLRDVPPIPTPVPVPDVVDVELAADIDKPWRVAVPAPRCPHGHFARWAARNCCAKESR